MYVYHCGISGSIYVCMSTTVVVVVVFMCVPTTQVLVAVFTCVCLPLRY